LEVPAPQAMPGQVLVRVRASVVSPGTEKMAVSFAEKNLLQKAYSRPDLVKQVWEKFQRDGIFNTIETVLNRLDQPLELGYSCSGEVMEVGDGVAGLSVGDMAACAGGGYASHAEIVCVPEILCANLMPFSPAPDQGLVETAAFAALGGIALHGLRTAELKLGETAAVIGLGLLGQIAVQLLKAAGCRVIGMDIAADRARLAQHLGADAVATSAEEFATLVLKQSAGKGADAVLITAATSSDEPLRLAAEVARDRAIVVPVGAVGLNVPRKIFYEKELDLRISRSYGPGRYDAAYEENGHDYPIGYVRWTEGRNMLAFVQLAAEGKVNLQPLITHRFDIQKAVEAYDLLLGKKDEPFLAILLTYPARDAAVIERNIPMAPAQTSAVKQSVSVGVIGAGSFATATLLPALKSLPGVGLRGVATRRGASCQHAAKSFGFSYCTTDETRLLEDANIQSVFILTRHNLHAAQVIRALDAGKHVFVEKPLALYRDELEQIQEAARRNPDKVLMVGFNRRFAPMAQQMKEFFSSVQEPLILHYRINAGFIPRSHWIHDPSVGGGRIIGECCHFIDFAHWIMGQPAGTVQTSALPDSGHYAGDNIVVQLTFPNGSLATISYLANGNRSVGKERIELHGGGRSAELQDFRRLTLANGDRRRVVRHWFRQDKGHQGECAAFIYAVQEGAALPIGLDDIYASTLATFAAVESMRSGRKIQLSNFSSATAKADPIAAR